MILYSNLPRLIEAARSAERVLDVGGWHNPFNLATHVVDLGSYATRQTREALDRENPERFSADTWHILNVCDGNWPFPDKYFDFSICSHILEDVRDPVTLCRELMRVAKRGYIEVPSIARELFVKDRWFYPKKLVGKGPEVGFYHHRWLCSIDGDAITFTAKTIQVTMDAAFYITRYELGRKLTEGESGICLWWEDRFNVTEHVMFEPAETLRAFKREALARLRR